MSKGLMMLSERLVEAEQQAALALAKAQQDLKSSWSSRMRSTSTARSTTSSGPTAVCRGSGAQQNSQYHAFINKLEQAATQQYEGVLQVRQALELRREEWLAAQQRRKAVELLLAKQAGREQLKAQRQEQKMLDEYATLRRFHHSGL
ncbi:flagellar export protein FliJ [Aeromonas sp. 80P]